jgi:undecaprenyl diphosphate synthase
MTTDPPPNDPDVPAHVAIIMDGNGRWAQRLGKNRIEGHKRGVENVRDVLDTARDMGIKYMTLYAFSVENWKRPKAEVAALMTLLNSYLKRELPDLQRKKVRLRTIGQIKDMPKNVQRTLHNTMEATAKNDCLTLNLALNYGARSEVVHAVQAFARDVQNGKADPEALDYGTLASYFYTSHCPDPDLIIRTSGEYRLSNFLLLQAAYSEIYYSDLCWPEFLPANFIAAIEDYKKRERRFGKTGEQIRNAPAKPA